MLAALRSAHLFAGKNERRTLRKAEYRARKPCFGSNLIVALVVGACQPLGSAELIPQRAVVVAGSVGNDLSRAVEIGLILRLHADGDIEVVAVVGGLDPAGLIKVVIGSEGIAETVIKEAYALVKAGVIPLESLLKRFFVPCKAGVLSAAACPALAPHRDAAVDLVKLASDAVERFDIMESHKVKAEAVDVVLVCPVGNRVDHVLLVHTALGSCLVTAARAVGVYIGIVIHAPIVISLMPHTIVVFRQCAVEARVYARAVGVVINDVHYNGDAGVVERLDHLLALVDSHIAVVGI